MTKTFSLLVILATLCSSSMAQKKKDTPDLTMWRGGKITFDVGLGLDLLGVGTGSAVGGGVMSPRLKNGAAAIFTNPAELTMLTSPQIVLDPKLGIGTGTFGLTGKSLLSDKTLDAQTDSFLKDSSIFKYDKINGFKVPSRVTSGSVGFNGSLNAVAVAFPVRKGLTFAIGSYSPIDLAVNMHLSDMALKLRATRATGSQTIGIDFLLDMAITANLAMQSNVLDMGMGWQVADGKKGKVSVGIAAKRYDVRAVLGLNMPIDGEVSIQQNEAYFNNPDDKAIDFAAGETNALKWTAHGDYRDTKWGYTGGVVYNATRLIDSAISTLNLSLVYDKAPSFVLSDPTALSESYQPVFLVGKFGGKGADSMQILIDSLRLSKPNLTRKTENVFSDKIILTQASSLTFGLDLGVKKHTFAFNYVKYFGDYVMTFSDYRIGKKLTSGVKFVADFELSDRVSGWGWLLLPVRLVYLDFDGLLLQAFQSRTGYSNRHYRVGGGLVFGAPIVSGIGSASTAKSLHDALGSALPVGFSLGRQYTIYDRFTVGVVVFGIPDLALRTSLGIDL